MIGSGATGAGGGHEGGFAAGEGGVGVGSRFEEEFDHGAVAVGAGEGKRGDAVAVGGADVGSGGDEALGGGEVIAMDGFVKGLGLERSGKEERGLEFHGVGLEGFAGVVMGVGA